MKTKELLYIIHIKQIRIHRLSPSLLTHWRIKFRGSLLCENRKCCHQRLLEGTRERRKNTKREVEREEKDGKGKKGSMAEERRRER